MLSGLGPAEHLTEHGVPVRADLPAVGSGLQDHVLLPTMCKPRRWIGPSESTGLCALGFCRFRSADGAALEASARAHMDPIPCDTNKLQAHYASIWILFSICICKHMDPIPFDTNKLQALL